MSRTVSPRVGSDGQPFPSRVARSSAGSRRSAASISSTVPSATEGAFAPGMFATAMPQPRRGVHVDGVHPCAHLVHQPESARLLEVVTRDGPQHVPDHLGIGQLTVEGIVVILGAVADIEPIHLWRKEFGDLIAGNEVCEDSYRHRLRDPLGDGIGLARCGPPGW